MSGFVDEAQLHVKAGDGGAGAVAFRREAHVDKGGPDGGDGGRGGNVWLVATTNQSSLLGFRDHPHRGAENGGHGGGKKMHGEPGAHDLEVPVPGRAPGPAGPTATILGDLANAGDRWLAGEGGRGGRGNASFLTNRRRAPAFAEQGEKGHEQWYDLELALVADVALVGFPNVGKCTLISADLGGQAQDRRLPLHHPRAPPGRGRGPATETDFTVADIPGLVEGAAEGKGLGHRFLRHITRARVLVVLVELDPVDRGGRRPSSSGCSSTSSAATSPTCSSGPGWWWAPRPTWWPRRAGRRVADRAPARRRPDRPARPGHLGGDRPGIRDLVGRLATLVAEARAAEPEAGRHHRHPPPAARGVRGGAGRATASSRWSAGWPSGRWPSTT